MNLCFETGVIDTPNYLCGYPYSGLRLVGVTTRYGNYISYSIISPLEYLTIEGKT